MSITCELIFDGGSVGNPGESYGSFRWRCGDDRLSHPTRLRFGHGTNNQAEYRALIEGLNALLDEFNTLGSNPSEATLVIRGDSRLVLKQVAGEWKIKNAALKELNAEAQPLLARFGDVQLVHQTRAETVRALGH